MNLYQPGREAKMRWVSLEKRSQQQSHTRRGRRTLRIPLGNEVEGYGQESSHEEAVEDGCVEFAQICRTDQTPDNLSAPGEKLE
jgi:hypothetical protein